MAVTTKKPEPEIIDCFASDETVTKKLAPTRYWVEIKRHLSAGEQTDVDAAYFSSISVADQQAAAAANRKMYIDWPRQKFLKLASYVNDWNLCDAEGKTVRLPSGLQERMVIMRNLAPRMADLIQAAVDEVVADELAARHADAEDDGPLASGAGTGPTP